MLSGKVRAEKGPRRGRGNMGLSREQGAEGGKGETPHS